MAAEREIGTARLRREDVPLVRGEATYTDDVKRPGTVYMAILRSQYGHARIVDVDVSEAAALDGVVDVYTAADLEGSDGSGTVPAITSSLYGVDDDDLPARTRSPLVTPERPLLAGDRVRYTGEPVAAVLAEDRYVAHDAAGLIDVEYDRLEAVIDPLEAASEGAPQLHDETPGNVAFDWEVGNDAAVDDAFAAADRTVSVDIAQQRISPNSMEPRTALAEYASSTGELTVYMGTQNPHRAQQLISVAVGVADNKVRVIAPEVGGGFGCKSKWYPAEPLAAWCATQVERPVKWQATRTESNVSDIHGRGRTVHGELAFDEDGTVRALRVESHANLGAYVSRGAPGTRTGSFIDTISGQYQIPAIHCRVRGILTNTAPVDSYRGSSRPMTILTVERLMHLAARSLDVDPSEFRRQNFIPPDAFPYETPVGEVYDSGDYAAAMDRALELVDYEDVRARQEALREEGRYLGIGFSCVMDNAGTGSLESARVRIHPSGTVTAYCGTADQGQGHRTTFAQLVADLLGVPFDDVTVVEGDTDDLPVGGGASGSRSVVCGGEVLRAASERVVEKAHLIAAQRLEVDPADLDFEGGEFSIRGAPKRSIHIQEVAKLAYSGSNMPEGVEPGLEEASTQSSPATFPFGTHVAVVEVDPETGDVDVDRYVAVDDCGVQLNPKLVEGQIVGGVIQGLGQALLENAIYDDNGTLLTGSMQDYAVPRSYNTPDVTTGHTVTPSPYNELGVKGAGESGATGPPAAISNAVADALAPFGVEHLDLPITPEVVWSATGGERSP